MELGEDLVVDEGGFVLVGEEGGFDFVLLIRFPFW